MIIFIAVTAAVIGIVELTPEESTRGQANAWARENIRRKAAAAIIVARFIPWARHHLGPGGS